MTFEQGDACNLRSDIGQFGCVQGANVLCRLPNPLDFLNRLPSLVVPGGIVVLVSPYTWLEEYTSKVNIKHAVGIRAATNIDFVDICWKYKTFRLAYYYREKSV